jgi:hypothetical protein
MQIYIQEIQQVYNIMASNTQELNWDISDTLEKRIKEANLAPVPDIFATNTTTTLGDAQLRAVTKGVNDTKAQVEQISAELNKDIETNYPDLNDETPTISANLNQNTAKVSGKKIVKTTLPELTFVNYTNNIDFINKFTNFLDLIGDFTNETTIALDYFNCLTSPDPITCQTKFFTKLEQEKFKTIDNEFIFFWYKKFKNAIDEIQNLVESNLGSKLGFFDNFSDSIGTLYNASYKIDDSTVPVADMTCSLYGPPAVIHPTLNSKISDTTRSLMTEMSRKNTAVMRRNLIRIQKTTDIYNILIDSTKPHGLNLVADINFFTNFKGYLPGLVSGLKQLLDKTYDFVLFLNNIDDTTAYNPRLIGSVRTGANLQKITTQHIKLNIERRMHYVDLLQKKVNKSCSDRSTDKALVSTTKQKTRDSSLSNLTNPQLNSTSTVNNNAFGTATPEFIYQSLQNLSEIRKDNMVSTVINGLQQYIPYTNFLGGLGNLGSLGNFGSIAIRDFSLPGGFNIPTSIPSLSPTSFTSFQPLEMSQSLLSIGQQFAGFSLPALPIGNFQSLLSFTTTNFGFKQLNVAPKVSITGFLSLISQFASLIPGSGFIGQILSSIGSLFGGGTGSGTAQGGLQKLHDGFNNQD